MTKPELKAKEVEKEKAKKEAKKALKGTKTFVLLLFFNICSQVFDQ